MRFLWPSIHELSLKLYEAKKRPDLRGEEVLLRLVVPTNGDTPWRVDAVRQVEELKALQHGEKHVYATMAPRTNVANLAKQMVRRIKEEFADEVSSSPSDGTSSSP